MPAIHVLSAIFARDPNGNIYRCLRCLRTFLFPLNEGDLSGKYVLVSGNERDQIWFPQPGDPDVPTGNHCAAVENTTREDVKPADAYRVEVDMPNCPSCGLGARFSVVGAQQGCDFVSSIFERAEDAQDLADACNWAYAAGRVSLASDISEMKVQAAAR